jgi:hypothetical protein
MHEPLLLRKAVDGGASVQHMLYRDYETRSRANLKLVGARTNTPPIRPLRFSATPMPLTMSRRSFGCRAIRYRESLLRLLTIRAGLLPHTAIISRRPLSGKSSRSGLVSRLFRSSATVARWR